MGYPLEVWEKDLFFWKKCVHPDDYEKATAVTPNTLKDEQVVEEYRMIASDGRVVWIRDHSALVRDANNKPRFVQGFWEDITDRKQAETARTHAEFELKLALERAKLLYEVTRVGISSENPPSLLQEIVQVLAQDLPANRVALITFDAQSQKTSNFVGGGPGIDKINSSVSYDELMEGLSGWVIRTGKSALSPKDVPDPRESEAVQKRRRETNCGSIIVVPLRHHEQIFGTLSVIASPDEPDFTNKDVELLEAVSGQISSAIIKITLEDNLHKQNNYLSALHEVTLRIDQPP